MKKEIKNWIPTGSVLAADPLKKVLCPVCQNADLDVRDIRSDDDPDLLERYMVCPACGAKNILRLRRPVSDYGAKDKEGC